MTGNIESIFGRPFRVNDFLPKSVPEQIRDKMLSEGIRPPDDIIIDGEIHRFATKSHDDAGWYVFYDDEIPAGAFGDWRSGDAFNWVANVNRELSPIEHTAIRERIENAKKERDKLREQKAEITANTVAHIWDAAGLASPDHPYLKRKQVQPHGVRITGDGRLIVPMYTDSGKLSSLQYIDSEGDKRYHPGGAVKGAFWILGNDETPERIFFAEGFATAATIFEQTHETTVVCFSAQQIPVVVGEFRERFSTSRFAVVADNDESRVGENYANQAVAKYGGRVILSPVGDANDYHLAGGDLQQLLNPADDWLISMSEFIKKPEPIQWLVKGWIQSNALMMTHGPSGSGKTFIVLDWVLHMVYERPWMEHKTKPATVVYLAGEGHKGLRKRVAGWIAFHGVQPVDRLFISKSGTDLDTPEGLRFTADHIRSMEEPPDIIIVDTLHRFLSGDENQAKDARAMIASCAALMDEFNCSVLLVHHTGNSQEAQRRARGSSSWRGAMDVEMSVTKTGTQVVLACTKSKDEREPDPEYLILDEIEVPGWVDDEGNPETTAIVQRGEKPKKTEKQTPDQEGRQCFIDAWNAIGNDRSEEGFPYITRSAWIGALMRDGMSQKTAEQCLRPAENRAPVYMKSMIEAELIEKHNAGYIAIGQLSIELQRT